METVEKVTEKVATLFSVPKKQLRPWKSFCIGRLQTFSQHRKLKKMQKYKTWRLVTYWLNAVSNLLRK